MCRDKLLVEPCRILWTCYSLLCNPLWDPNDPGKYASLIRYWELVKFRLENATLKAVNLALMYSFKQEKHGSSTDFVDKL